MSVYQKLFDKLDATIAAIEGSPVENPVMDDAVDLLRRLGIVAASLLNGSVAAFAHLILEDEQPGAAPETESDGDGEGQEQTPISGDEAASESGQTTEGSVEPSE